MVEEIENGWNLTFRNGSVDCRDDYLFKDYHHFLVYENGSVIKVGGEKWVNKTVRIWTDKLEYKIEEVVKVYIFNGLNKSICFSSFEPRYIERIENGAWKEYYTYGPCSKYKIRIFVVNSQETNLMKEWGQTYYVAPSTLDEWCKEIKAPSGEYRFKFQLIYYSNEFKIINSTKNDNDK